MNDGPVGVVNASALVLIPDNLLQRTFSDCDHGNLIKNPESEIDDSECRVEPESLEVELRIRTKWSRDWRHDDQKRGEGWKSSSHFHRSWERHLGNARRLANMGRGERAGVVAIFNALPKARFWMSVYDRPVPLVWELERIDHDRERELQRTDDELFDEEEESWDNDWYDDHYYDMTEEEQCEYLSYCLDRYVSLRELRRSFAVEADFEDVGTNWFDDDIDWADPSLDELEEWESDRYWEDRMTDDPTNEELDDQNVFEAEWEEFIKDDEETEIEFEWDIPSDSIDDFDDPREDLPKFVRIRRQATR